MGKTVVLVLGVVLIIAGIAGFIGALTPDGNVLGLFYVGQPGTLHNLIHIVSGVAALASASSEATARLYAKIFGVVYALVTLLGFFTASGEKILGLVPINSADNFLHISIAAALLYVGFGLRGDVQETRAARA